MTATATPPRAPLPKPIERKLSGLRGHLRRIDLLLGLSRLVLALLAFHVATFVLDRALDLPVPFRAVLLAIGAGTAAYVAWRWILRPLAVRRSDDEVALLVERAHPELNDELISAVQLSRRMSGRGSETASGPRRSEGEAGFDEAVYQSSAMVDQVIAGAAERAERIDFGRVADTRDLRRLALLTLAVAGIVAALFATRQRDGWIWIERMLLLRDTPWPRLVELEVDLSARVIARGDDVAVTARVVRGNPTRVVVVPTFERGGRADEIAMLEARGEFRAVFDNVNDGFRFYVEGGDYRSRWYEVAVRPRPKLEDLKLWLEPPAYTGLPPTPADEPLRDGNLKVPQGTLVRYEGVASEPLRAAEVALGMPSAVTDHEAAAVAGGDAKLVRGKLRVKDSTAWSFRLVSAEGFESGIAAQYQIRAIPDRLPDVRVVKPGRNKEVTARASLPLKVEVKDDYLPRAAALVYVVQAARRRGGEDEGAGAAPAEPAATEMRVPLDGLPSAESPKSVTLEHAFELEPVKLSSGDKITYWVEAVDNRAPLPDVLSVPAESRGRSERYQLLVVGEDDIERAAQNTLRRLQEELIALAKTQQAATTELEALAREMGGREKPDIRDKRRLAHAELDQRKVSARLEAARRTLDDVREEKASNKAGKEEDLRWLTELSASAQRLAEDQAARAAQGLSQLRQAEAVDPTKLSEVTQAQQDVVEGLNDIVRELSKRDESIEAERALQDLIRQQEEIREATQRRFQEEQGR